MGVSVVGLRYKDSAICLLSGLGMFFSIITNNLIPFTTFTKIPLLSPRKTTLPERFAATKLTFHYQNLHPNTKYIIINNIYMVQSPNFPLLLFIYFDVRLPTVVLLHDGACVAEW
ncbi:MAG: hypothetical protein LBG04_00485 [Holosporaceae bacterium]|nr:hypothetical protein [Holosporaceae bacterium]